MSPSPSWTNCCTVYPGLSFRRSATAAAASAFCPRQAYAELGRDKARYITHVSSSPPFSTVRAAFTAHGATPLVDLHSTSYEASVSISMASTEVHPCFIPFRQHARAPRSRTACAFAGYLVRHLPLYFILPEARGLRHGEYAPCGRRYRPPTTMPHPTLRAGFGVSLGSPLPTSHSP